jgi:hypothetical protein
MMVPPEWKFPVPVGGQANTKLMRSTLMTHKTNAPPSIQAIFLFQDPLFANTKAIQKLSTP